MMARASIGLTPGISASRVTAGITGASGPVLASGPVVPSALMPQAVGIAATICSMRAFSWPDLAVQGGDLVQQQGGELAVVVIEHAVQGLHQLVVLGLHPGAGQGGQHLGVALPGDHRLDHVCADTVVSLLATLES